MPLNVAQLMEIPGGPGTDIGAIIAGSGVDITSTGVMNTIDYLLEKVSEGNNAVITPSSGIGDVVVSFDGPATGDLPSGTKMLFFQAAAPTGWVKDTSINNSMVRIVSGQTGGSSGGTLNFTEVFTNFTPSGQCQFTVQIGGDTDNKNVVASGSVTFQGQVTPAVIDNNRNPAHQHDFSQMVRDGYGGQQSWDQGGSTNLFATQNTTSQGGSAGHTHGSSGSLGFSGANNNHQHGLFGTATTPLLTLTGTPMNLNLKFLDSIACTKS